MPQRIHIHISNSSNLNFYKPCLPQFCLLNVLLVRKTARNETDSISNNSPFNFNNSPFIPDQKLALTFSCVLWKFLCLKATCNTQNPVDLMSYKFVNTYSVAGWVLGKQRVWMEFECRMDAGLCRGAEQSLSHLGVQAVYSHTELKYLGLYIPAC